MMAEKWDDSANDSPEVVYEGFSSASTHPQRMINTAGSSFVATDGSEDGPLGRSAASFMHTTSIIENQGEGSHHEEIERNRLCFVCCNPVSDKNFESVKASMNHSHAPLLVLLTDVLGYKLEDGRLHSQVVCKACYHLLDIIDELQQTLTESKTDVRTKFLETIQKLKLKYPRTDKMLKPRCLRCIQMSQTTARKRGRGRSWKGRSDDIGRGKGRSRGKGRAIARPEDGHVSSDNDADGQGVSGQEVIKDVLPSKSHQPCSYHDDIELNNISKTRVTSGSCQSGMDSNLCNDSCVGILKAQKLIPNRKEEQVKQVNGEPLDSPDSVDSVYSQILPYSPKNITQYKSTEATDVCENHLDLLCTDCSHLQFYECCHCNERNSEVIYQYCETCFVCYGTFIPWGYNINVEFIGERCYIWDLKVQNHLNQGKMHLVSQSSKYAKSTLRSGKISGISEIKSENNAKENDQTSCKTVSTQESQNFNIDNNNMAHVLPTFEDTSTNEVVLTRVKEETCSDSTDENISTGDVLNGIVGVEEIVNEQNKKGRICVKRSMLEEKESSENIDNGNSLFKSKNVCDMVESEKIFDSDIEVNVNTSLPKNSFLSLSSASSALSGMPDVSNTLSDTNSIVCSTRKDVVQTDLENSYIVVNETLLLGQDSNESSPKDFVSNCIYYKESEDFKPINSDTEVPETLKGTKMLSESLKVGSRHQRLQESSDESSATRDRKTLADLFAGISNHPSLGKRTRKLSEKAREIIAVDLDTLAIDKKSKKNIRITKNVYKVNFGDAKSINKINAHDCKFICEYCGKKFISAGGFRYHVDSHEVDKPKLYSCNFCIYRTRRQADLRKHSVIHTGERHYKCEICGQEFTVNSSYKRHQRIHSGEKPYKCTTCGRDFRNSGTLKQHMVKHTGAKNFVCEICGNSFSLRHHYTTHRKLHSGEMPFKCIYCGTAFRNHGALRLHRKKNHPKEEANRLKQLKLKRTIVREEVVVRASPKVIHNSLDVLEQAMAATVDPLNYEYVNSYTQTLPDLGEESVSVISEIITEKHSKKDSVVLAITHLEEGRISVNKSDSKSCINSEESATELHERNAALVTVGDCKEPKMHQSIKVLPGSFCSEENVDDPQEFMVLKRDEQSVEAGKPNSIEVVNNSRSGASQMYIMLSDAQAQDSHLYIVVENNAQAPT
ncbi:uncharacterized protein [Cherax quadricarinatus]|uniref:uncharacterized protein isoform X1 n=1 Tax=Cherax quadricarinatus TaxID=27406 RepID=UPI002379956E|nr:uncharacterized protein LOC128689100 isoform X1 [Cherax quadricarinatus]